MKIARLWDPVEHLRTEADVEAYLQAAAEEGDSMLIEAVLCDIARAQTRMDVGKPVDAHAGN